MLLLVGGSLLRLNFSALAIASTRKRLLLHLANEDDGVAEFLRILGRDRVSKLQLIYNDAFRLIGGHSKIVLNFGLLLRLQDHLRRRRATGAAVGHRAGGFSRPEDPRVRNLPDGETLG